MFYRFYSEISNKKPKQKHADQEDKTFFCWKMAFLAKVPSRFRPPISYYASIITFQNSTYIHIKKKEKKLAVVTLVSYFILFHKVYILFLFTLIILTIASHVRNAILVFTIQLVLICCRLVGVNAMFELFCILHRFLFRNYARQKVIRRPPHRPKGDGQGQQLQHVGFTNSKKKFKK